MAEENKELRSGAVTDNSNWLSAVIALTKLTQIGQLKWRRITPSEAFRTLKPEGEFESVYMAEYKDYLLRIYEEMDNQSLFQHSPLMWTRKPKRRMILEMLDNNLETLVTFPQVNALPGLLSAVKYQVSDIRSVLDGIVKEAELIPDSK